MTVMLEARETNPAEDAGRRALDSVFECIDKNENFRLEAGAGAPSVPI